MNNKILYSVILAVLRSKIYFSARRIEHFINTGCKKYWIAIHMRLNPPLPTAITSSSSQSLYCTMLLITVSAPFM